MNATDWIEVTSKTTTSNSQPTEQDEEQKVEMTAADKKKKKRNNKKKNAMKRAVQKEFRDRCVSPEYDQIQSKPSQADILITNLNRKYHSKKGRDEDIDVVDSSSQSGQETSSVESMDDYKEGGYHAMHVE